MKPTPNFGVFELINAVSTAQKYGFGTVEGYRIYRLDGANKVASAEWIEAHDDKAAIEAAKSMMDGHGWELWDRKRLVIRTNGKGRAEPI